MEEKNLSMHEISLTTGHPVIAIINESFLFLQTRRRAEKMGRQCMFLERAVESEGKQTVQYASLHRPEWLLGFNGRKRRLETTPQGDKIALARSVIQYA